MKECKCSQKFDRVKFSGNLNAYNNVFPKKYMYGHAYTPNQIDPEMFMPKEALKRGSLYPELVSDYYPGQSMEEIEYLERKK